MGMAKKQPTKAELEWMGLVKQQDCITCGRSAPSIAHHIRDGQGMSERAGHYSTIPLCEECHVGGFSIHKSRREFTNVYGSERQLLNQTIGLVFQSLRS